MAKDLRQKIIDAAVEIGARQGLSEVTNTTVAAKCKVSTAATYYHFKNKYEIILQTSLYVSRKLSDYIELHTDYTSGFERTCRTSQRAFIEYLLKHRSYALFYYQISMSHTHVLKPSYVELVADFCPCTKILRRAVESGLVKKFNAALAATVFFPMYTFVLACHRNKYFPPEPEIDELINIMWEAMDRHALLKTD